MDDRETRLGDEVALLESMYPDQVTFDYKAQEIKYIGSTQHLRITIRLPPTYLATGLPEVLTAACGSQDLRESLKSRIQQECEAGEECLDRVVSAAEELAEAVASQSSEINSDQPRSTTDESKSTVIVWLHHLLNTNKRKQALSPPSSLVAGLSKPGYPGVLVYSGPSAAVKEHIDGLKALNWQAFQVRLESPEEWRFGHGKGVKEFAEMSEVVADIGDDRKQVFMEAMRMK